MRIGMGAMLLLAGTDHFVNAELRYVPMIPDTLTGQALAFVWLTGATEIAGGLALMAPQALYERLSMPRLRQLVGWLLALQFGLMVAANVNVALKGAGIEGLPFGAWYYWLRPAFQPLIMWWALYASGAIDWPLRERRRAPISPT
jgi:uncharacterized membrane protein